MSSNNFIINVEICKNCENHKWCLEHREYQYSQAFNECIYIINISSHFSFKKSKKSNRKKNSSRTNP